MFNVSKHDDGNVHVAHPKFLKDGATMSKQEAATLARQLMDASGQSGSNAGTPQKMQDASSAQREAEAGVAHPMTGASGDVSKTEPSAQATSAETQVSDMGRDAGDLSPQFGQRHS